MEGKRKRKRPRESLKYSGTAWVNSTRPFLCLEGKDFRKEKKERGWWRARRMKRCKCGGGTTEL